MKEVLPVIIKIMSIVLVGFLIAYVIMLKKKMSHAKRYFLGSWMYLVMGVLWTLILLDRGFLKSGWISYVQLFLAVVSYIYAYLYWKKSKTDTE